MSWQAMAWAQKAGKDYQLQPTVRLLLLTMANYADPEGNDIFPAIPTLEDDTGLSRRTIRRHKEHLCDIGILEIGNQRAAQHIPAAKRPTVYRFNYAGRKDPDRAPYEGGIMPPSKDIDGNSRVASCPPEGGIEGGTMPPNTYKPKSNTPAAQPAHPGRVPEPAPEPDVDVEAGAAFRAQIAARRQAKRAAHSTTANDSQGLSA